MGKEQRVFSETYLVYYIELVLSMLMFLQGQILIRYLQPLPHPLLGLILKKKYIDINLMTVLC